MRMLTRRLLPRFAPVLIVAGAVLVPGAAPAAAAAGFSYPFTTTNEGWRTNQGVGGANAPAAWSGGAASITDERPEGYDFFLSPTAIAGDYGANFGGTLSLELKSSATWIEEAAVAVVGSANNEEFLCMYEEEVFPDATFHTSQFTLDGAHTYLVDEETGECTTHPSDLEVSEVLSTLLGVIVSGEDEAASSETTTIDNVTLSGGAPLPTHKLTVLRTGSGSGTISSSPAGIDCGATCSAEFLSGSTVTLTATPASGSTFAGWSGAGCSGTGTCQAGLGADREVTATFEAAAGGGGGGQSPKPLRCRKGFKKKRVHGKARCVKIKKKKKHHHHHRHHR
jgi:Divergent InlB B-repeat domain